MTEVKILFDLVSLKSKFALFGDDDLLTIATEKEQKKEDFIQQEMISPFELGLGLEYLAWKYSLRLEPFNLLPNPHFKSYQHLDSAV